MKEFPLIFTGPSVRGIAADIKFQTRRLMLRSNCLVDGGPPFDAGPGVVGSWNHLDFAGECFIDRGPSPAGNPGPYLKVPHAGGTRHRIYPRRQVGDRAWVKEAWRTARSFDAKTPGEIAAMCLDAGYQKPWGPVRWEADGAQWWHDWPGPGRPEDPPGKLRSPLYMPRWASRTMLELTAVRPQQLGDIDEVDAKAEGVEPVVVDGAPSYRAGFAHAWNEIHGETWETQSRAWVWSYTFRRVEP